MQSFAEQSQSSFLTIRDHLNDLLNNLWMKNRTGMKWNGHAQAAFAIYPMTAPRTKQFKPGR
jgi:hypothetical protein